MFLTIIHSMPTIGLSNRMRRSELVSEECDRFKSVRQAQRFLSAHAAESILFNLGRHLIKAEHYRDIREGAFAEWGRAVA
jgi:hypothetical protein